MITRATRLRLLAFAVMALVAVTYGAIQYVNLPRLVGFGRYPLTLQLPDGAGLYPNGVVSLRGVPIGQVDEVRLGPTGAVALIQVDDGVVLPRSSVVEVRSTSAVGEQYVDFAPQGSAGPAFGAGDVIPAARIRIPTTTSQLLDRADSLVASVPTKDLNTTVDELATAFGGNGDDLGRLLDSARQLQAGATANLGPTTTLIDDGVTVLDTQRAAAGDIRSWAHDLASFTGRLQDSDPQLRGTLDKVPGFLGELSALQDDVAPTLPLLLANLTSTGEVLRVYLPNVEQTVTILSATVNGVIGAINSSPVPGTTRIDFRAIVNNPPACTNGFQEQRRSPADLSPAPPGTSYFCDEPAGSPMAVRGARNAPCPVLSPRPDGRSNTASGCGLDFQTPAEAAAATAAAIRTQLEVAATNPKTAAEAGTEPPGTPNFQPDGPGRELVSYDPATGGFLPPGSTTPVLYGEAVDGKPRGWQDFLLNPLGVGR